MMGMKWFMVSYSDMIIERRPPRSLRSARVQDGAGDSETQQAGELGAIEVAKHGGVWGWCWAGREVCVDFFL
ncbi:hypothetical protein A6A04_19510 [Paramagnetospirillum marisnigri]|uniref:Uncharacterized protein n=1 Tax=Paramagnetospirillum marisnigri TaxID=1285242 RepID=A0A178MMX2_9PROT|nr:hypothetical protein A6A04_19510 [Paramagnetospirillum marisnigri]